jgi:hypothetical protein
MAKSYKTIDELRILLSSVVKEQATLVGGPAFDFKHNIHEMSREACVLLGTRDSGVRRKIGDPGSVGKGSFSTSQPFSEIVRGNSMTIQGEFSSRISERETFLVGYMPLLIKTNRRPTKDVVYWDGDVLVTSDPIHEAIITALLSILYDSTATPHFIRGFAFYLCPLKNDPASSLGSTVLQMSGMPLFNYSELPLESWVKVMTIENLIVWTYQIAYTFYVAKKTTGLVHYDTHWGNILVLDRRKTDYNFLYGGAPVGERLQYEYSPGIAGVEPVVMPISSMMLQVIDFGIAEIELPSLSRGGSTRFRNQIFDELKLPGNVFHDTLTNNADRNNTREFYYFICTALYRIFHYRYRHPDPRVEAVLDAYARFAQDIEPGLEFQELRRMAEDSVKALPGNLIKRDWGPRGENIEDPIIKMTRYLKANAATKSSGGKLYVFGADASPLKHIVSELKHFQDPFRRMQDTEREVLQACSSAPDSIKCTDAKAMAFLRDPARRIPTSIYASVVRERSLLLDGNKELREDIDPIATIPASFSSGKGLFSLQFQGDTMGPIWQKEMGYKNHHFSKQGVSMTKKRGKPLEQVNVHVLVVDHDRGETVGIYFGHPAIGTTKIVSCTSEITKLDVTNPLLKNILSRKDQGSHLGFFYRDGVGGTKLPVPLPYETDFAVVYVDMQGEMQMLPYTEFVALHKTDATKQVAYELQSGKTFLHTHNIIRMLVSNDMATSLEEFPQTLGNFQYASAVTVGPILVRNGVRVFDENKMLNERMTTGHPTFLDIKCDPRQNWNYKWVSETIDQRDEMKCNFLESRAMLICDANKNISFLFVEGGGQAAPVGIDMAQATWLAMHFEPEWVVSLNSPNLVFQNKYLMDAPFDSRSCFFSLTEA